MSGRAPRARYLLLALAVLGALLSATGGNSLAELGSSVALTLSNPSCVQPSSSAGACYIVVGAATANGSDPTFSGLEISVDHKLRLRMLGFFEADGYVDQSMIRPGLKVVCGLPGASGDPAYGLTHLVEAKASMAGGAQATGAAQVRCPSFDGRVFGPKVGR